MSLDGFATLPRYSQLPKECVLPTQDSNIVLTMRRRQTPYPQVTLRTFFAGNDDNCGCSDGDSSNDYADVHLNQFHSESTQRDSALSQPVAFTNHVVGVMLIAHINKTYNTNNNSNNNFSPYVHLHLKFRFKFCCSAVLLVVSAVPME